MINPNLRYEAGLCVTYDTEHTCKTCARYLHVKLCTFITTWWLWCLDRNNRLVYPDRYGMPVPEGVKLDQTEILLPYLKFWMWGKKKKRPFLKRDKNTRINQSSNLCYLLFSASWVPQAGRAFNNQNRILQAFIKNSA